MGDGKELILVADDDEDIVRFVEVNLRLEGFDVHTVSDGEQALHAAHDLMPDLVLLDVMMPRLDGFEVCHRLRSDSRTKHLSVIMLTANPHQFTREEAQSSGATIFLTKPFSPTQLLGEIRRCLAPRAG